MVCVCVCVCVLVCVSVGVYVSVRVCVCAHPSCALRCACVRDCTYVCTCVYGATGDGEPTACCRALDSHFSSVALRSSDNNNPAQSCLSVADLSSTPSSTAMHNRVSPWKTCGQLSLLHMLGAWPKTSWNSKISTPRVLRDTTLLPHPVST